MRGSYVLYGGGVSRSAAVEIVLRELDYELAEVDVSRGRRRSEDFMRVNPAGCPPW